MRCSRLLHEIVAADRHVERVGVARHGGDAGSAPWRRETKGLDEGAQNRQGQIRMMGFDRLIEPFGKLALVRQCTIPLAIVVGDAANLPLRQFQIDQRQRRIGPGSRPDQSFNPCGFFFFWSDGRRRRSDLPLPHGRCEVGRRALRDPDLLRGTAWRHPAYSAVATCNRTRKRGQNLI
jgi:hypothetical protein